MKTQSMPMVPSTQIFATNGGVSPLIQQQSSPTLPNASGAMPSRMLPIPPDQQQHPDDIADRRPSSSPGPGQYPVVQNGVNTHYPRPIGRQQPTFLNKFTGVDSEQHMTEVLADIERADQHQSQNQFPTPNGYASPYVASRRSETPSPPKDPNVERLRSPNHPDARRQREQARESPKARERQPTSPGLPTFVQHPTAPTPERRLSPAPNGSDQVHREYHARDSANAPRRATITTGVDPRA